MPFIKSTASMDEAAALRAVGFTVTTVKQPCSPRAVFEFEDNPETRDFLEKYTRYDSFNIPPKRLLIARSDLYREARAARGGL